MAQVSSSASSAEKETELRSLKSMKTISELLSDRASEKGDAPLWSWFEDPVGRVDAKCITEELTYASVDRAASALAARLVAENLVVVEGGERVLLVFEPSLAFVVALFACNRAGAIAVPVFPPEPRKGARGDLRAFVSIAASSGAKVALTSAKYNWAKKTADIAALDLLGKRWPEHLRWIVVDSKEHSHHHKGDAPPPPRNTHVAFLQYTSGSTSEPKGVVVTHKALWHNLSLIVEHLEADESTVVVSWLPQYHDMGLIGSYMGVVRCGGRGYYTSPFTFVKRPASWVEAISAFRGTHMQAPNFAYALAARKPPATFLGLDLSCVRHMINGAEPVETKAMESFYAVFEKFAKLKRGVIHPTYGLAEHTVFVCGSTRDHFSVLNVSASKLLEGRVEEAKEQTRELVGCGRPRGGVTLKIVDPNMKELAEGLVGEIWLRSESVADAYWGREPSDEDFAAPLQDQHYLRTGDVGFLKKGELFVCGRLKDLIILRGKNHYPHDIERTVERSAPVDVRPGCIAAFSVEGGGSSSTEGSDKLVVIAEVRDPNSKKKQGWRELCASVAAAVAREHGVPLQRLVLVKPRTIAKTTSGKIARRRCAAAYTEGSLAVVESWRQEAGDEDEEATETQPLQQQPKSSNGRKATECGGVIADLAVELAQLASRDVASLGADVPLVDLGIDSMALAQMRGVLESSRFGCTDLPEDLLFREDTTIASLAVVVDLGNPFDEDRYAQALATMRANLRSSNQKKKKKKKKKKNSFMVENCPCCLVCCPHLLRNN